MLVVLEDMGRQDGGQLLDGRQDGGQCAVGW